MSDQKSSDVISLSIDIFSSVLKVKFENLKAVLADIIHLPKVYAD